jgi:hypothetical protein
MAGLVPGIHAFLKSRKGRRGWPASEVTPFFEWLCPAMTTVIAPLPAMTEMMFWPGFPPPKLARPAKGSGENRSPSFCGDAVHSRDLLFTSLEDAVGLCRK